MDEKSRILRERAVKTAQKTEETAVTDGIDLIRFRIGEEVYALEAAVVNEVHDAIETTPIPYMPPYIEGIVNIRGRFVSVVDLGMFLEIEKGNALSEKCLLFLSNEKMEFAVSTDAVLDAITLSQQLVRPISQGFTLAKRDLISGVTEEGTIVLDGRKLLGDPGLVVYQEVTNSFKGRENVI